MKRFNKQEELMLKNMLLGIEEDFQLAIGILSSRSWPRDVIFNYCNRVFMKSGSSYIISLIGEGYVRNVMRFTTWKEMTALNSFMMSTANKLLYGK